MRTEEVILEQWFTLAIEPYPGETVRFLASEKDRFRNPVGFALRENLAILVQELHGKMDLSVITSALQAIVRLRAVQNISASQAVEFIFQLRPLVRELMPEYDAELLGSRIDQLALIVFEEYVRCREQLSEIRVSESRRAMAIPEALSRARG